jgi:hypothetical protein
MNNIRTSDINANSRMGFTNEALRFLQESYKENFKLITQTLNRFENSGTPIGQAVILSGCEQTVTATDVTITEGVIYYQGEVFYSPFIVVPITITLNTVYGIVVDATNSYGNPIEYDDNALKDSLRRRTFTFFAQTSSFGGVSAGKLNDFANYAQRIVSRVDTSTLTLAGTSSFAAIISITSIDANNFSFISKPYDAFYSINFRTNIVESTFPVNSIRLFLQNGITTLDQGGRTVSTVAEEPFSLHLHYTGLIPASSLIRVRYSTSGAVNMQISNSALYANEIN